MIEINTYSYVEIGLVIRYLRSIENITIKEALEQIKRLHSLLTAVNFNVSIAGMTSLNRYAKELEELPQEKDLTQEQLRNFHNLVGNLESIIFAEAHTKKAFFVTDKRYNINFLLYEPWKIFPDGIFSNLPKISQVDFFLGCRCIAFELGTAAAFHILRATEAVLRELYLKKIKKKILDKKQRTWGPMIKALKEKKRDKLSESLINNLDNIRANYRNPTQHPEAIYSMDKVQDLLGLCIDVVNKMTVEIEKQTKKQK